MLIGMLRSVPRVPVMILLALALLVPGCAAPGEDRVTTAAYRVTGTPIPTPAPTPVPVVRGLDTDLDQFENSGGRIRWIPTSNSGPFATNGKVELPTLGRSAPLVKVDVNSRGEMAVPSNARDVGWLDQGPWPGQTQNPVLAGHIAYSKKAGTFNRIQDLNPGDPVHVTMDGVRYTYRIIWVRLYDRNTPHVEKIMGYTEVPSVTLITCGGTFDRRAGTHSKRVVARAQIVTGV